MTVMTFVSGPGSSQPPIDTVDEEESITLLSLIDPMTVNAERTRRRNLE
jgi:hypothetical protein